jgi:hypothetical protein
MIVNNILEKEAKTKTEETLDEKELNNKQRRKEMPKLKGNDITNQ